MSGYREKILVALDGSEKSLKTVNYLCDFKPFTGKEIVLFNVFSAAPDCYWDMSSEDFSKDIISRAKGWEAQKKKEMETFMETARQMLIHSGYSSEKISVCIKNRKRGIARDIIAEAEKGYYALLARRRGYGALMHVVLGSTTRKIIETLSSVPVLLAGTRKSGGNIFITLDGSEGSRRALDFTARAVSGFDCRVVLCGVLRDYDPFDWKNEMGYPDQMKSFFYHMQSTFSDAEQKFKDAGVPADRLKRRIITGVKSRAGAIAAGADEEGCDTIVMGRKGVSNVKEFTIGRVPWKVVHAAKKMNVWIVP